MKYIVSFLIGESLAGCVPGLLVLFFLTYGLAALLNTPGIGWFIISILLFIVLVAVTVRSILRRDDEGKKWGGSVLGFFVTFVCMLVVLGIAYKHNDPSVPLTSLCNALNKGDEQAAYDQFSPGYQSTQSYNDFVQMMQQKQVTGCIRTDTWNWDSVTRFSITLDDSCTFNIVNVLEIQTDNGWKIDQLNFEC